MWNRRRRPAGLPASARRDSRDRPDGWQLRRIALVGSDDRIDAILSEWEDAGWLIVSTEDAAMHGGQPTRQVTVAVPPPHLIPDTAERADVVAVTSVPRDPADNPTERTPELASRPAGDLT